MSCIRERKVGEDGQLVGYLLERDGLEFVVSMRDLYDESIVEVLTTSGYKYHDYYGDIENEAGISIKDLSASVLSSEDNTSFLGAFEQSALTEQQMLQYMSVNMKNIQTVEFREPVNILIKTREELISYLNGFQHIQQMVSAVPNIVPLNAICAKEALFTVDEISESTEVQKYMSLINRRRTFVTRSMLDAAKKFFNEQGLLPEDKYDDMQAFVEAWFAWGPEGIKSPCVQYRIIKDAIFACEEYYTGTGQEELTLLSREAGIRQAVNLTSLQGVPVNFGYGLIDKQGNVHYCGKIITPNDVVSNVGDVLLRDEVQQKYNEYRRNAASWKADYMPIKVLELVHTDRICMTLQAETGQVYMYRADPSYVCLVDSRRRLIAGAFGRIKFQNGAFLKFDAGFNKDVIVEQIIFRQLVKELLADISVKPIYKSTVEMCEAFGLHYEQIIDYIEYIRGNEAASGVLHDALPGYFYDIFGSGLENLPENATLSDRLEILMENLDKMTTTGSQDYVDFASIMSDMSKMNTPIWNAAVYLANDKPMEKFNAVLDFDESITAGSQLNGAMQDSTVSLVNLLISLVKTTYMLNHKEYEPNAIMQEIIRMKSGQYFDMKDISSTLSSAYVGSLTDIGNLAMRQLKTAEYSVWALGVVNEISGAPVNERRHLAFFGFKMAMGKGTGIRNIINSIENGIEMAVKRDNSYFTDKDRNICINFYKSYILRFIWAARSNNPMIHLDKENGTVYANVTCMDGLLRKHVLKLTMKYSEYQYITSPTCPDFTPFVTSLHDWCRYTMTSSYGTVSFYCVAENVTVNPWYVKVKEKYNDIPVYNGAINLVATDAWESVYKTKRAEQYNSVMNANARAPICIGDVRLPYLFPSQNNLMVDAEIFKEENKRLGINSDAIPETMIDYYLADDKTETFQNYYRRAIVEAKKGGAGNRMLYMPLKSDIYYSEVAKIYGYVCPSKPIYNSEAVIPSQDYALTSVAATEAVALDVNQARITPFNRYEFTLEELTQCIDFVYGRFESKEGCYVGPNTIVRASGQRLSAANIGYNEMQELVSLGIAFQMTAKVYIIYAVNGAFVVEV